MAGTDIQKKARGVPICRTCINFTAPFHMLYIQKLLDNQKNFDKYKRIMNKNAKLRF